MKCSIALQILPLANSKTDKIVLIDEVISYLKSEDVNAYVSPFETVIEGEYEKLMLVLKNAISLASKYNSNIFANVKINCGSILTTDEKIKKHHA